MIKLQANARILSTQILDEKNITPPNSCSCSTSKTPLGSSSAAWRPRGEAAAGGFGDEKDVDPKKSHWKEKCFKYFYTVTSFD